MYCDSYFPTEVYYNMEKRKILLLDLDKTIRYSKTDPEGFIDGPDDIAIYDDVYDILEKYLDDGYEIVGVTNQGGVAFGIKTIEQVHNENERTTLLLNDRLGREVFCLIYSSLTHHDGHIDCFSFRSLLRKPYYGLLVKLEIDMHEYNIICDWDNSLMVGDMQSDKEMAEAANIPFKWAHEFFNRENKAT